MGNHPLSSNEKGTLFSPAKGQILIDNKFTGQATDWLTETIIENGRVL